MRGHRQPRPGVAEDRPEPRQSQPQRLGLPVTVPYSRPILRMVSPMPVGPSSSSVGNGPRPTREVYALMTPIERVRCLAGTPEPLQMPATELLELVTYG